METIAKRQRDTYISTLNHDLKIPTIAQIRALELLLDESMGSINHAQKEILNSTLDSCRYMYEMLSTITNTYKYENKDFELNKENFEITEFIHECFGISNENFKQKNVNIILHSNNLLINIFADKLQLKKAFKNLINYCASNIYENSTLICNIRKSHNHETVFISIVFQSPYLSVEKLKNMFNMYTTPTEKMDKVGSGLGLYLAKQIIEAHSGEITISSNENNLCMYNIKLPCINECKFTSL
jgi:two-component system NarL family sensor kinase